MTNFLPIKRFTLMEQTPTTASDSAADHVAYAAHTQAKMLFNGGVKSIESFVLAAYSLQAEVAALEEDRQAFQLRESELSQKLYKELASKDKQIERLRELLDFTIKLGVEIACKEGRAYYKPRIVREIEALLSPDKTA